MMQKWKIRHLPVLDGSRVIGLLTLHDLHLTERLKDIDPRQVSVEDAMTLDLYTVGPDADLRSVAREMAGQKFGSALVMRDDEILGIFTAIDALRALSELVEGDVPAVEEAHSHGTARS